MADTRDNNGIVCSMMYWRTAQRMRWLVWNYTCGKCLTVGFGKAPLNYYRRALSFSLNLFKHVSYPQVINLKKQFILNHESGESCPFQKRQRSFRDDLMFGLKSSNSQSQANWFWKFKLFHHPFERQYLNAKIKQLIGSYSHNMVCDWLCSLAKSCKPIDMLNVV